ncbi:hypothetical protein VEA_003450 [Vibrio antiquarius]|uniref:Uncharacterized protein n=1 Tax=Vibrio antiquarius (strain Ex25) TaxID=150340 RepID=A0ACA6QMH5_VIBAE|nr:hypothetical protein [Vibrio antiquarius]ACY51610.1 hypothetical protein VEA_003450 [Vibrio antiquarius]
MAVGLVAYALINSFDKSRVWNFMMYKKLIDIRNQYILKPKSNGEAFYEYKDGEYKITDRNLLNYDHSNGDLTVLDGEIYYVSTLRMKVSSIKNHKISIMVKDYDGNILEIPYSKREPSGVTLTYYRWDIKRFVKEIKILSSNEIYDKLFVLSITGRSAEDIAELMGDFMDESGQLHQEIEEANEELRKLNGLRSDIQDANEEKSEIDSEIKTKKLELGNLNSKIEDQKATILNLEASTDEVKKDLNFLELESDSIKKAIRSKAENLQSLNENKEKINNELRRLELERSKYSEDFVTYKEEIQKQNYLYLTLFTLGLIISYAVFYKLIEGAYNLAELFNKGEDIYQLILSRTPIVIIYIGLLGLAGKGLAHFYSLLKDNLEDMRRLKKTVYLVTHISESQSFDLIEKGLETKDVYKMRVDEKMKIVRDLLSIEMSENHQPSNEVNSSIDMGTIKDSMANLTKKL